MTELDVFNLRRRSCWAGTESAGRDMAFNIEITPRIDSTGATVYAVIVTIDDHETVVSFESKEVAERFAETERVRITAQEQQARSAKPT